jgi:hypothetical protein
MAFTLNLVFAEEILVNHPVDTSPPQGQLSYLIIIRDPITPFSNRSAGFTRDEPIKSTRSFKPFKGSISYWPGRNPNLNRGKSTFSSARSFKFARDCTSTLSSRSFSFTKSSSDPSSTSGPRNSL